MSESSLPPAAGPRSPSPTKPVEVGAASLRLPALSVIVPNYNHAKYLELSLPAILHQSVPPLELIVLDDASTDNSVEVIQRFADQNPLVRFVRNEQNLGAIANVKKGVALARGECVFVAPADDEIVPGLFEKSLTMLARHPQAALCCAAAEWRETFSGLTWHMAAGMPDRPCYLSPDELVRLGRRGKLCIITSSCIVRRAALAEAGGYFPDLRWHADWFACYIPAFRRGVCFLPEVLSLANILPRSLYQAGHSSPAHRKVLLNLLEQLDSPACADVRPRVRDSGALSLFGLPMLRLICSRRSHWPYLNVTYLRRTLRRSGELAAKRVMPRWLARRCLGIFYPPPQPEPSP